jgi:tetratricopeptide (TPR) repeat protein
LGRFLPKWWGRPSACAGLLGLLLLILLLCLSACARRDSQQTVPQVAILRFENLSADAPLDWMGGGFAEVLSGELQGSPQRYAIQWRSLHSFDNVLGRRPDAPGISAESTDALVVGANQIVYGYFSVVNGVLNATATEEDLVTHKMVRVASASGSVAGGIFPVAEALARQLGETQPFGTRNARALRDYAAALESPDPVAASQDFASAVAADPDFGRAYLSWLETAIAQRDRAEADRIVEQARLHRDRFSAIDRAGLDLGAAALRGDFHTQLEARRELARLDPADPDHHRALAEALMSVRDYDSAIVEFRRALSIRPDDTVALNMMGYAAALSGDLPTATRVLRGYEQLRPNEPNPLDSLGDAHFALGHFGEAEQFYLAARAKAPGFMNGGEVLKAAQARLMTGDVPGATALFNRYLAEREAAHDPNAPFYAAGWSWQTGARRAAIDGLDRLARADADGALREVASRADAQAAIWLLNLGDRAGAAEHAREAVAEAVPATAPLVGLVAFLAQAEAFSEPAQSSVKDYAQAYALLYGKQFQPAVQALQEIYRRPTNDLDDGLAVLLAWAYEESGDWQRAEPLLRLTPLPQATGLPIFGSLYFPRLFFLRGVVLEREGHRTEASRYYQMFRKLSGPDSAIWGEEQRAR